MRMSMVMIAAAIGVFAVPAAAQQTPGGTSAGGPARVGIPGQIGGGVPGTQPNVVEQRMTGKARKASSKKRMKKAM
ncbi:MAG: hypothetical protein JWR08_265 [Enterovirga sp.]|jgi:hypothetical protein|nr:hypothetical protein [Enterovirga sp.]